MVKILNGSIHELFRETDQEIHAAKRYSQFSQGFPESPVDSTSMFIDQIGLLILCSTIFLYTPPSPPSCLTSFHGNKG